MCLQNIVYIILTTENSDDFLKETLFSKELIWKKNENRVRNFG